MDKCTEGGKKISFVYFFKRRNSYLLVLFFFIYFENGMQKIKKWKWQKIFKMFGKEKRVKIRKKYD